MQDFPPTGASPSVRHTIRRLPAGLYTDKGIGDTIRVLAIDAGGNRVLDSTMTRALFDESKRAGVFDVLELAVNAVCCDSPEFLFNLTSGYDSPNGSSPRGD